MILSYTGKAPKAREWTGPITGAGYLFGGDRRRGLVDVRDGLAFLRQRTSEGAAKIWEQQ